MRDAWILIRPVDIISNTWLSYQRYMVFHEFEGQASATLIGIERQIPTLTLIGIERQIPTLTLELVRNKYMGRSRNQEVSDLWIFEYDLATRITDGTSDRRHHTATSLHPEC
jgi:hypothetical protein